MNGVVRGQKNENFSWRVALFILCVSAWYLGLGIAFDRNQTQIPYFVTDWMVTFAGGFVRRGLLGQMFWSLAEMLHTYPLSLIFWARVVIASAYLATLGIQLYRRRHVLGLLGTAVILLNPLIGFYAWFSLGSLDVVFLLVAVVNLWISQTTGDGYWKWACLLFGTVGVFLILSHEAFLFLGLPINLAISWYALREKRGQRMAAIYGLPVLAVGVTVLFHGSEGQMAAIMSQWSRHGVELPYGSAMVYLPDSLGHELAYVRSMITPLRLFSWFLATLVCVLPLTLLWLQFLKNAEPENRVELKQAAAKLAVFPLAFTLPLYAIGTDWNRWLAVPFATAAVCLLMAAPIDRPYQSDRRMRAYLLGLVLVSLIHSPAALYNSVAAAANGPLITTQNLISHKPVTQSLPASFKPPSL